jgi:hypothetical protein
LCDRDVARKAADFLIRWFVASGHPDLARSVPQTESGQTIDACRFVLLQYAKGKLVYKRSSRLRCNTNLLLNLALPRSVGRKELPVPACPCPDCDSPTGRWLEESSKHAWVSYYRCEQCGCIWTYPKGQEGATTPTILTVSKRRQVL